MIADSSYDLVLTIMSSSATLMALLITIISLFFLDYQRVVKTSETDSVDKMGRIFLYLSIGAFWLLFIDVLLAMIYLSWRKNIMDSINSALSAVRYPDVHTFLGPDIGEKLIISITVTYVCGVLFCLILAAYLVRFIIDRYDALD